MAKSENASTSFRFRRFAKESMLLPSKKSNVFDSVNGANVHHLKDSRHGRLALVGFFGIIAKMKTPVMNISML